MNLQRLESLGPLQRLRELKFTKHIITCHSNGREMNEIRIVKKMAQITILFHLLDRLCNGELPEAGRKAVKSLIAQLNKEIDDIKRT